MPLAVMCLDLEPADSAVQGMLIVPYNYDCNGKSGAATEAKR